MAEHLLKNFDDDLNKLRYRLVKMGTLVQQQVEFTFKALLEDNLEYAKLVIETEKKVDKLDIKIDKQCLKIFALHQPVAMDLRLVLAAVSINDKMELIGDLANNIAHNIIEMNNLPGLIAKTKFPELTEAVQLMLSTLMDSYVNLDDDLAIEVIKSYSDVKRIYFDNFNAILLLMKNDIYLIELGSFLIDINRNIQVISRQARTIAQELVFLVEARMIRHQNIEEIIKPESDIEQGI
ncbi:MAG: phosphate signaling complex protein PhoU [FCB group bacterium]|jgi:phosphate transport system protein